MQASSDFSARSRSRSRAKASAHGPIPHLSSSMILERARRPLAWPLCSRKFDSTACTPKVGPPPAVACPNSHDCNLDAVDRGQRIEQAVPLLAALPPDPELTGRRSEVERGNLEAVDVHRVAQDGEVALLVRQPTRESAPRVAAILAAPHRGRTAGTGARRRLKGHDVHRVGVVRMDNDWKSEVRRQSPRDRSPRAAVVVAAQYADVWPRAPGPGPICPSAVVLYVEPAGRVVVPRDLM